MVFGNWGARRLLDARPDNAPMAIELYHHDAADIMKNTPEDLVHELNH
jgi:hypothetical protein